VKITPKIIVITVISLVVLLGIGFGLYKAFTMPLPGQAIAYDCSAYADFSQVQAADGGTDRCRMHVPIGNEIQYGTNPPVFGPHYADWVRAGVFDGPKDDRNIVHSLEHGYIIVSYNCFYNFQPPALPDEATPGAQAATSSAQMPPNPQDSQECRNLVSQLTQIYNDLGKNKLIIVPRPQLDARLALTAWGRIDKWNPDVSGLSQDDISRVRNFIEVLRGHGPEKTME
jgi:hypothetical protein